MKIKGILKTSVILTLITIVSFKLSTDCKATTLGNVTNFEVTGSTFIFTCGVPKVKVIFYTPDMVRVWLAPDGINFKGPDNQGYDIDMIAKWDWLPCTINWSEEDNYYKLESEECIVRAQKSPFRLSMYKKDNTTLVWKECDSGGIDYGSTTYENLDMASDEHFYGGGIQHARLDHRGNSFSINWITSGNARSESNYSSMAPFYMSTKGYGVFWYTFANGGTYSFTGPVRFCHTENRFDCFFFYGPSLKKILSRFTELVGRPILYPRWAFNYGYGGSRYTNTVVGFIPLAEEYRNKDMPAEWFDFEDNDPDLSDVSEGVAGLGPLGFHLSLWSSDHRVYTGIGNGAYVIPEEVIAGARFWKLDNPGTLSPGNPQFTLYRVQLGHDTIENNSDGRGAMWAIGGWTGAHRYMTGWTGDQTSNWDYIRWGIKAVLSGALSGYYATHDMDGIYGGSGPTYVRDCQFLCFTSGMYGLRNKNPWSWGEPYTSINRNYLKLRMRLMPYTYTYAYENYAEGYPLCRPMVYEFQEDPTTWDNTTQYQYMYGEWFLVAPVYTESSSSWPIYLPQGKWVDYWDGAEYTGPQNISYNAPLDKLPLLVKKGAIIPMQPVMLYDGEVAKDPLTLDIYPHQTSSFTMYEDDGITREHRSGVYCLTNYECIESTNIIQINISTRSGAYTPEARSYILKINGMWEPVFVTKDGNALTKHTSYSNLESASSGWYYGVGPIIEGEWNSQADTVWVKFPDNGQEMHIIVSQVSEPDHLECVANPDTIIANESDTSLVSCYVKDEYENIIETATHTITFSITGEGTWSDETTEDKIIQAENGVANITVKSTVHQGSMTVIATTPELTEGSVTIQTIAGPATKISLFAKPSSIVADNIDVSTITATIVDINNNRCYLATNEIAFTTDLGYLVGQNPQNAIGGQAYIILKSTKTGTAHLGATATGLIQGTTNVVILPGEAIKINLDAQPTEIIADGVNISTITAKIEDEYDNLCYTRTDEITFGVNEYGVLIGTNPQNAIGGIAKMQMRSTNVPGIAKVSAQALGLSSETVNVITTGLKIELEANPLTIIANNEDICLIKATIKDQYGYKVDTATNTITFTTNKGNLIGKNPIPCENGEATILLKTTQAGVINVSASSEDLAGDSIEINGIAGEPTKIILSAEPESIIANGIDISTITAKVVDKYNNLVESVTGNIEFFIEGEGTLISDNPVEILNGMGKITVKSTLISGMIKIKTESRNLESGKIELKSLAGIPTKIICNASKYSLIADNRDKSIINAYIVDANYNSVETANNEIIFTVEGPGKLTEGTTVYSVSATSGIAQVELNSTLEIGKIIIEVNSLGLNSDNIEIESVIGEATKIRCYADKDSVLADGISTVLITANIEDKGGHKIDNATNKIRFDVEGPGILIGNNSINAESGVAQIKVKSSANQTGEIRIIASSKDLAPGEIKINSFNGKLSLLFRPSNRTIYIPGPEINIDHDITIFVTIVDTAGVKIDTAGGLIRLDIKGKQGYPFSDFPAGKSVNAEDGKAIFEKIVFPNPGFYTVTIYGDGIDPINEDITVLMSCGDGGLVIKEQDFVRKELFVSPFSIEQIEDPIITIQGYNDLEKKIKDKIDIANKKIQLDSTIELDENLVKNSLYSLKVIDKDNNPLTITFRDEFDKKAEMIWTYSDEDNNKYIDGTNIKEDNLRIFYLDLNNSKWCLEKNFRIDLNANKIKLYITELDNTYCIMGVREEGELSINKLTNYPNPFKEETRFIFDLGCSCEVKIKIYTVSGRLIKEITKDGVPGYNEVEWNGKDEKDKQLANGVYLYKIIAEKENKKIEKINKLSIMK